MTKRRGKAQTANTKQQKEEAYGDTWAGRGQELQDQEDLEAGRLEGKGTPQNPESDSKAQWTFPIQTPPEQPSSPEPQSEPQSKDSVIENLMKRHPGLTEAEAIRHLEAYGG